MVVDFADIRYSKSGNKKQQDVYHLLSENRILQQLHEFDPILVGTIPIGIDLDHSDLDIICYYQDPKYFHQKVCAHFGNATNFKIDYKASFEAVVAGFRINGFELEIFGQNVPTREQNGYLHMLAEHRLLTELGSDFRREIVRLKARGYKTEPAFAKVLGLPGNPYEALLKCKPEELIKFGWLPIDGVSTDIEGK